MHHQPLQQPIINSHVLHVLPVHQLLVTDVLDLLLPLLEGVLPVEHKLLHVLEVTLMLPLHVTQVSILMDKELVQLALQDL